MSCIICGLATGDGCVPLCALHMPLSELAGLVELGEISDWPEPSDPDETRVSHTEMMCDKLHPCAFCGTPCWGDICLDPKCKAEARAYEQWCREH